MASPVINLSSQFLHNAAEPLDRSEQVATEAELQDITKVPPYVGKMVHVTTPTQHRKNSTTTTGRVFICTQVNADRTSVWRPVMEDDGSAFYLTSAQGEVFAISAVRDGADKGRIQVTFPAFE